MKVIATGKSKELNLKIAELGRIAKEGEKLEITEERFKVLNGDNKYNAIFVIEEKKEEPKEEVKKVTKKGKK